MQEGPAAQRGCRANSRGRLLHTRLCDDRQVHKYTGRTLPLCSRNWRFSCPAFQENSAKAAIQRCLFSGRLQAAAPQDFRGCTNNVPLGAMASPLSDQAYRSIHADAEPRAWHSNRGAARNRESAFSVPDKRYDPSSGRREKVPPVPGRPARCG